MSGKRGEIFFFSENPSCISISMFSGTLNPNMRIKNDFKEVGVKGEGG